MDLQRFAARPWRVALATDHYATWSGSIAESSAEQIAFVPVDYHADGSPPNATEAAVPVLIAHEVLVSNPGEYAIEVAPAQASATDDTKTYPPSNSTMKPFYADPTTFPAVTDANAIIVPAGAVAFPIRVMCYGITISSPNGATTPSVVAYGPLSLEA